jgi:uncharacterized DUF497 family protein
MGERIDGFDWDEGNHRKCRQHGVSLAQVEEVFANPMAIYPDRRHSQSETRFIAIGCANNGRYIFLAFTFRAKDGRRLIRPISARFMHRKEIRLYEKENPSLQDR